MHSNPKNTHLINAHKILFLLNKKKVQFIAKLIFKSYILFYLIFKLIIFILVVIEALLYLPISNRNNAKNKDDRTRIRRLCPSYGQYGKNNFCI